MSTLQIASFINWQLAITVFWVTLLGPIYLLRKEFPEECNETFALLSLPGVVQILAAIQQHCLTK